MLFIDSESNVKIKIPVFYILILSNDRYIFLKHQSMLIFQISSNLSQIFHLR